MLVVAFTAWQAFRARDALQQVAGDFEALAGSLSSGDGAGARERLGDAQDEAARAAGSTVGPGWWLGAHLPWIGDDIDAVRTVAHVADGLASDALPGVLSSAEVLDPGELRPVDGRVDLQPLEDVAPAVVRAARVVVGLEAETARLDPDGMVPQVAGPVTQLQDRIAEAADLADRASRAVRLMPPMLGADGPRRYVLMFQNSAEARSTGGIPGAFAVIEADDGRVQLAGQSDAGRLGRFPRPVVRLTDEEQRLFGAGLARFPQDVNLTPDFPRTAQIVRAMWQERYGEELDGVLSTDPVALSQLLGGTGPVQVGDRTVDAGNAVDLLLRDTYAEVQEAGDQNQFFDLVARSVFQAVVAGQGEARAVLDGLTRSVQERRTLVWSARPEEERVLRPTVLSGAFPQRVTAQPQVGVYANAALPYKLDYYVDRSTDVEAAWCRTDRQRLVVTVRLSSNVPQDPSTLPFYVAPDNLQAFDQGTVAQTLYLALPAGARVTTMKVDGQEVTPQRTTFASRPLVVRSVSLAPGESRKIVLALVTAPGQVGDPVLQTTPGATSSGVGAVSASACS